MDRNLVLVLYDAELILKSERVADHRRCASHSQLGLEAGGVKGGSRNNASHSGPTQVSLTPIGPPPELQ